MDVYVWEGRSRKGTMERGELSAANEAAVRLALRRQQIQAIKIEAKPKDILKGLKFSRRRKVKEKDIVVFTRQFATMIDAGLPLVQCLEILGSQQDNATLKEVLLKVKADVEAGSTFADALRKHPTVFNELFCNLVTAGETGGILDTILNRLAAYIEKSMNLKKKVKGAMVYPIAVLVIAMVVVVGMLVFVIPVFQKMFADMGGTLPAFTQMVINLSDFMRRYFLLVGAVLVALYFVFQRYYKTEKGQETIDALPPKASDFRIPDPESGHRQVHPDIGDDAFQRGPDPRGLGYCGPNCWKQDHRESDPQDQNEHRRGKNHSRASGGQRGFPPDGRADDLRGRIHRCPGFNAEQDCGLFR